MGHLDNYFNFDLYPRAIYIKDNTLLATAMLTCSVGYNININSDQRDRINGALFDTVIVSYKHITQNIWVNFPSLFVKNLIFNSKLSYWYSSKFNILKM